MLNIIDINIVYEDWGENYKDFQVFYEVELSSNSIGQARPLSFVVLSPLRLQKLLEDSSSIELGRGKFIMDDYNHELINKKVYHLFSYCLTDEEDETFKKLSSYFEINEE